MTQEGVARAVWIDVRHVVQYVRPLRAEGLLRERTAHIQGGRRRRKVYDLTDSGRLAAYRVREAWKIAPVRVREGAALREATAAQVLEAAQGRASLLDVLRQALHAGAVDPASFRGPRAPAYVEMLRDAPAVEEFLGRARELALLLEGKEAPRVLVVRGVAGIGKSTLAAKACEALRGSTNLFWHRVRPWDTPQSLLVALGGFLAALGKPGLRVVLAEGQVDLAPQVLRETLPGVEAFLVLDDAHEARPETADFLRFLKDAVAEAPGVRLLVLTRRSVPFYDRRDVTLQGLVQEVDLGALAVEDLEAALPAEEARALPALFRHPLFLRLLRASRRDRTATEALLDVRRFLEEAVYADLSESERRMMKVASLYAVPVPRTALFADPELTHDVALELRDRALLTSVSGEALVVHDTVRDFFASLSTDAEREGLLPFVVRELRALAAQAQETGDQAAALRYLLNAAAVAPSGPERPLVFEELGDVRHRVGDMEGSVAAYRRALEAATGEAQARLHRKLASNLMDRGEIAAARREVEAGFGALGSREGPERGWLAVVQARRAEWLEEFEEAKEQGELALQVFRAWDDVRGQAEALRLLGLVETVWPRGDPSAAQGRLEEALALAEELGDRELRASVSTSLAFLFLERLGELREAEAHLTALEALPETYVDSFHRVKYLTLHALVRLVYRGDLAGAEALLVEALSLAERFRSGGTAGFAKYLQARGAHFGGRPAEARDLFQEAAAQLREQGVHATAVESLWWAGECALLQGDVVGFLALARGIREPALARGAEARPVLLALVDALEALLQGDGERMAAGFEEALRHARRGIPVDEALPCFLRSVALEALGRPDEAAEALARAETTLEAFSRRGELASLPGRRARLLEVLRAAVDA